MNQAVIPSNKITTPTNSGAAPLKAGLSDVKLTLIKDIKLPTGVYSIDAYPKSGDLFAACFDGGIYRVSPETGAYKLLGKHESYASGVRVLPKSGQVVSAGYDGAVKWFSADTGASIRSVQAHKFWSWKMRTSPDETLAASVTGQYMAGGIKYEPAPEREPSVQVYDTQTGKLRWSLPHVPPVLSVAFSPDSRYLAAGNLMGEIRIWDMQSGKQVSNWTTPDFTCWGIIKSHLYIGGIFDMSFGAGGSDLFVTGMGPMIDPMAGNGKQTWQRFAWQTSTKEKPAKKLGEIADTDAGHGLMEVVRQHPTKPLFAMAGRLAQGKWNTALFDASSGKLLGSVDSKVRVTDAVWTNDGQQLVLSGIAGQEKKNKAGKCPDFGHIKIYSAAIS